ncbi:MAG: formate--phosphoribosylaminoimidazolecarboxamide ligase [Thermoproteales archaeon]|nr:formate--phosphoribosylaminoimidazolecarboxamide ligase [Thermoproteales archaeon]
MIRKEEIDEILKEYNGIKIATICSHSALQIFHGAKKEGFKTVGICLRDRIDVYESFPLARPDIFIIVDSFEEFSEQVDKLREMNSIIVPHASFVSYIGVDKILNLELPIFGNRLSLLWESNRERQAFWLQSSGLKIPKTYMSVKEVGETDKIFVKYHGAKGGSGYFVVKGSELKKMINGKKIDLEDIFLQEFISGVRYYPHFFYSPLFKRLELLSMDKRVETIDECYRGWPLSFEDYMDYTVSGNMPVIVRESLLKHIIFMGKNIVKRSKELFYPGILGPFCLETIYHPEKGFYVFEVSARIVAGTNLFPMGSFYSWYIFDKPMSTGRRIAYEIRIAKQRNMLNKVFY